MKVSQSEIDLIIEEEEKRVNEARKDVEIMEWPEPDTVTKGITKFTMLIHMKNILNVLKIQ